MCGRPGGKVCGNVWQGVGASGGQVNQEERRRRTAEPMPRFAESEMGCVPSAQ